MVRNKVREACASLHAELEKTYPFHGFSSSHEKVLNRTIFEDYFKSLAMVFLPAFNAKSFQSNAFYEGMKPFLPVQGDTQNPSLGSVKVCDQESKEACLAYRYVFVGSRMGVNQIYKTHSQAIDETPFKDFFIIPFPRDEWTQICQEIESLSGEGQELFVCQAKQIFRDLIQAGQSLS